MGGRRGDAAKRRVKTYLTVTTQTDEEEQRGYVLEAMYPFSTLTPLAADVDDMQNWYSESRRVSQLQKGEGGCQEHASSAIVN